MAVVLYLVLLLPAVLAGLWLWSRREPADELAELVATCYGDRDMAERLVTSEAKRKAGPRRVLIERALARLREDRAR